MMKMKSILMLVTTVLLVLGAQDAWSQNLIQVEGKVTNGSKPLPDVQVVLTFQDNNKTYKIKTDKNGAFFIIGVNRGAYTVDVFDAAGQSLYQKKNQQILGAGGNSDKLEIDVASSGGNAGQPRVTQEQVEAIKAANAKAVSINALIAQYQAASQAKDWQGTIAPLQGMIAADPARWEYYQALGTSQLNLNDYENAAQTYDKGIQVAQGYVSGATPKDPKNPNSDPAKAKMGMGQMLSNQGNAYLKLHKNPEAIAAYTKAAELDPNPGTAYFNICATQYNTGNTEGALAACDKAIAADPNKADAYFIKGSLLIASSSLDKEGKVKPAPGTAEALKRYLELAPDGGHATDVKQMLEYIGSTVETTYKSPKKK
jgi:tetratricopeptide (TPR) repeat protein